MKSLPDVNLTEQRWFEIGSRGKMHAFKSKVRNLNDFMCGRSANDYWCRQLAGVPQDFEGCVACTKAIARLAERERREKA